MILCRCRCFRRSSNLQNFKILKKRLPSFFIRERKELHALKQNNKAHPMVDLEVLEVIRTQSKAGIELYEYVKGIYGQMKAKYGF